MKELIVKNMVCERCKKVVEDSLKKLGLDIISVELGHIKYLNPNNITDREISDILVSNGFELIESGERKLIEEVKIFLIKTLENLPVDTGRKLSDRIAEYCGKDYSSISKIFSRNEHITIEKYFIKLKIEKVKELIRYSELTFSEIADQLDYSSSNHLSQQFKNETGMSMTDFKNSVVPRKGIDEIM